jgi:hypothetical protein
VDERTVERHTGIPGQWGPVVMEDDKMVMWVQTPQPPCKCRDD